VARDLAWFPVSTSGSAWNPRRWWRPGLRARTAVALALGGLAVSVTLGFLAYELARGYLIDKRLDLVRREAVLNARFADGALAEDPEAVSSFLPQLSDQRSPVLVQRDGQWYGAVVGVGESAIPADLRAEIDDGTAAVEFTTLDGDPAAVVGVPLPRSDSSFFQVFSLVELEATLTAIRNSLAIGAFVTTAGSAVLGLLVSRRVLRPLTETARTAERITAGDMSARLEVGDDPDLVPLAHSFNEMADALDQRIEREKRFAADVSHELRTPLTALNSAVHLIERRSVELSDGGHEAVEVLRGQIDKFTRLVLEILDLSRLEADLADVVVDSVELRAALGSIVSECGVDPVVLDVHDDVPPRIRTDPRRLRVILRNLVENAQRYGDGCTSIEVWRDDDGITIQVDDHGPGLETGEHSVLFERFRRGSAGVARGSGTGLGLALVAENARALGGEVEALDAPGGGARFRVTIRPVGEPSSGLALPAGEGSS
jgi:two-component system, OmpR family, sensor histidine kinase MtrB